MTKWLQNVTNLLFQYQGFDIKYFWARIYRKTEWLLNWTWNWKYIDLQIERRMSFPPLQLAEKHHFDKKSDFASKFMKSRDYGVAPISGKSSCGMFLSAVRSTYSGCAQTSKYQVLGLDEFQSVNSVKPIKEQRRSSFKDVFHGSSIFSGIAFNILDLCYP